MALEFLLYLPIATAVAWYGIVTLQVYRDRVRTWTETFFLFGCFFVGTYAISDLLFFRAGAESQARLAAGFSLTSITFASTFFLLFSKVYLSRMRRRYLIALLPAVSFTPLFFSKTFLPSLVRQQESDPWIPHYEPTLFAIWALIMGLPALLGLYYLYKTHRIVAAQNPRLGRRTAAVFGTLTVVVLSGLLTNAVLGSVPSLQTIPPPFSSLLAIPGAVALYALSPISRERISEVLRKFRARQYRIVNVYLVYNDGTLIASRGREGGTGVDRDLFSATLDVIQNFMRTSFPFLRGTSLRTIEHGDARILMERGRHCYLTVVLTGEENDLLRRQMRDSLLEFEAANAEILRRWRGVISEASGTDELFRRLLEPSELFGQ